MEAPPATAANSVPEEMAEGFGLTMAGIIEVLEGNGGRCRVKSEEVSF